MHEDFDALLPASLAAARVGVSRQLLNYWRRRGWLAPDGEIDGQPAYRLRHVLEAEAKARRSRSGARSRIVRCAVTIGSTA